MFRALKRRFKADDTQVQDDIATVVLADPVTSEEWTKLHQYKPWLTTLLFDAILTSPGLSCIQIGNVATYDAPAISLITSDIPFIRTTEKVRGDVSTRQFFPNIPDEQLTNNPASKLVLGDPFYYNTLTGHGFLSNHPWDIELNTWMIRLIAEKEGGLPTYMALIDNPFMVMAWRDMFRQRKAICVSDSDVYHLNRLYILMLEGVQMVFAIRKDLFLIRAQKCPYGIYLSIDNADPHEVEEIKKYFSESEDYGKIPNYDNSSWNMSEFLCFKKSYSE